MQPNPEEQEQDFPGILARIAPMNVKLRKCLIINERTLRFMGKIKSKIKSKSRSKTEIHLKEMGFQGAHLGGAGHRFSQGLP